MSYENFPVPAEEQETMTQYETVLLKPAGFGYGEGSISSEGQPDELKQQVHEAVMSSHILTRIDTDDQTGRSVEDDGCGDGRAVGLVTRLGSTLKRSLNRAKVFGGGLVIATASRIGLGHKAESFDAAFDAAIDDLEARKIDFGAHTGDVTDDTKSGCGALDEFPEVLRNTIEYGERIRGNVRELGIDYDGLDKEFDDIEANFKAALLSNGNKPYSGARIMNNIKDTLGKVVKHLAHKHAEMAVVINTVPGYTVNQNHVRQASGSKAQVFATDAPRLQELADRLNDSEGDRRKALLASLMFTLGVSATLTRGDLPVYIVRAVA